MERLIKYFVPEKYVLDLNIEKHAKKIGGRVSVVGVAKAETIKFHAVDMKITEVLLRGKPAKFSVKDDILEINLGKEYCGKNADFHIYYERRLNDAVREPLCT